LAPDSAEKPFKSKAKPINGECVVFLQGLIKNRENIIKIKLKDQSFISLYTSPGFANVIKLQVPY
jgi:hypothetical protein